MFNLFNPLVLALSRAMREERRNSANGWEQMLERRESGVEIINPVIGAPIYVPRSTVERDRRSN